MSRYQIFISRVLFSPPSPTSELHDRQLCGVVVNRLQIVIMDTSRLYGSWSASVRSYRILMYQRGKTNLDLLKQETVSGSGISWATCKSAPRSRQITMPAPHHSVFLQAGCPSCCPTNSVKALKAKLQHNHNNFLTSTFRPAVDLRIHHD